MKKSEFKEYLKNEVLKMTEATDEDIAKQKELNAELEKTKELMGNMEEGKGSTVTISKSDMDKLHSDGEIEVDDHTIKFDMKEGRIKKSQFKEYLKQEWNFTSIPELEADDLVSIYHTDPFGSTVICSPDKDVLYQNRGIHYNYGKAETVVVDETEALTFLWKQMLMGDPGDGIPGIPKIGPKTAELIVKDQKITDLPQIVLNKYIEKFGILKGITIFEETFNLIYILRSADDVLHRTGIQLEELHPININILNNSANGKS